jgi:hypothetical protein
MTEGLCRYLALPQFSQLEALYLRVKVADISLLTATILEKVPHVKALFLCGRGYQSTYRGEDSWSIPAIFDMIRRLGTLRELQFPLQHTIEARPLFSHIPHLHTLHLVSQEDLDGADLNTYLNIPPLPNIRVLTLVAFEKLKFSTMKRVLLAFPQLKMLSLRYTYFAEGILQVKEQVMADLTFAGRAEGWLDRIEFDLDNETHLRTGQAGWVRANLSVFDDVTGEITESVGDLIKTYDRHHLFCD